jgi:hypothetical protein
MSFGEAVQANPHRTKIASAASASPSENEG